MLGWPQALRLCDRLDSHVTLMLNLTRHWCSPLVRVATLRWCRHQIGKYKLSLTMWYGPKYGFCDCTHYQLNSIFFRHIATLELDVSFANISSTRTMNSTKVGVETSNLRCEVSCFTWMGTLWTTDSRRTDASKLFLKLNIIEQLNGISS